jgi:cob(I)alamin adenosyltransferase
VPKESLRVEAYGTVDELNSQIGVARASGLHETLDEALGAIQNQLFRLGSDLCFLEGDGAARHIPRMEARHVEALERLADRLSEELPPLASFILPGGSPGAARLHVARTVCRRAERLVAALGGRESITEHTVPFLNRLSDVLFVMARYENLKRGVPDVVWDGRE